MDCRALPFSQLPHQPKIFLDSLGHFSKVKKFYAHEPNAQSILAVAQDLKFPKERAGQVAEILRKQNVKFGSDTKIQSTLDRLSSGAVAVVSGQQVGLFGGPSYSIYKALMAIQVADELTREGVEAVRQTARDVKKASWIRSPSLTGPSEAPESRHTVSSGTGGAAFTYGAASRQARRPKSRTFERETDMTSPEL